MAKQLIMKHTTLADRLNFQAWVHNGGRGTLFVYKQDRTAVSVTFSTGNDFSLQTLERIMLALETILGDGVTFDYITY